MNDINIKFYEDLKRQRNVKKITLEEIGEYTKINIKYLDALENGDFSALPNVYSRLFLRSYCDYIGADYKKVLDEYEIYTVGDRVKTNIEKLSDEKVEANSSLKKSNPDTKISKSAQNYKELIIAATVIAIIIILFIILNVFS